MAAAADSKRPGGRIYRIDRECYVIYVGSDDHRVRPFLRVGTSQGLPERIRQYIGTVVLSDRLTGTLFDEADTVAPFGSTPPDYTGSAGVVKAARPFLATRRVHERPVVADMHEEPQGAFVQFFTDGNIHLIVNGHHIFDLDQREQLDQHDAWRLDRAARIVAESEAAYRADSLTTPGFIITDDGSLFAFRDGLIEALLLAEGALVSLAHSLVSPAAVTHVAGMADPRELQRLASFAARRRLVRREEQVSLTFRATGSRATPVSRLADVLRAIGVSAELTGAEEQLPAVLPEFVRPRSTTLTDATTRRQPLNTLTLPEEAAWSGAAHPPIVRGIPIRVHDSEPDAQPAAELERVAAPDETAGFARLARLLVQWNRAAAGGERPTRASIESLAAETQAVEPMPLLADIYPGPDGMELRFGVQPGFTRGRIAEAVRARERLAALAPDVADEEYFADERRRLLSYLDELLSARRATLRAAAATSPPAAEESAEREEPSTPEPEATVAAQARPTAAADAGDTRAEGAAPVRGAGGTPDGEPRRRRRVVPIAVASIAALLIALALILFLPRDRAPAIAGQAERELSPADDAPDDATTDDASGPREREEQDAGTATAGPADQTSGDEAAPAEATPPTDAPEGAEPVEPADEIGSMPLDTVVGRGGNAEVTVLDIIRFVNRVAEDNGYAPLGTVAPAGRDPDWIYPGNTFVLPDGEVREVVSGDTLWQIAAGFLVQSAAEHDTALTQIRQRIRNGERPLGELRALLDEAYVESVRREARNLIQQLEA